MYSFYLQHNIYNIYLAENSLEHVVPVASHHHRVCSAVCVLQADSVPLLCENRLPTWRLTRSPYAHADGHVCHGCQSPSTISTSDLVSTEADCRVESFNVLTATPLHRLWYFLMMTDVNLQKHIVSTPSDVVACTAT